MCCTVKFFRRPQTSLFRIENVMHDYQSYMGFKKVTKSCINFCSSWYSKTKQKTERILFENLDPKKIKSRWCKFLFIFKEVFFKCKLYITSTPISTGWWGLLTWCQLCFPQADGDPRLLWSSSMQSCDLEMSTWNT